MSKTKLFGKCKECENIEELVFCEKCYNIQYIKLQTENEELKRNNTVVLKLLKIKIKEIYETLKELDK